MGVTPLMLESLDKFAETWHFLWTCPVEWDVKKGFFVYNGISKKLVPWAIALYLISFPLMFLVFLFVFAAIAGFNRLPFINYVINMCWLVCYAALCVGEVATLLLGREGVPAMNALMCLHRKWAKSKLDFVICKFHDMISFNCQQNPVDNQKGRIPTCWGLF